MTTKKNHSNRRSNGKTTRSQIWTSWMPFGRKDRLRLLMWHRWKQKCKSISFSGSGTVLDITKCSVYLDPMFSRQSRKKRVSETYSLNKNHHLNTENQKQKQSRKFLKIQILIGTPTTNQPSKIDQNLKPHPRQVKPNQLHQFRAVKATLCTREASLSL